MQYPQIKIKFETKNEMTKLGQFYFIKEKH